MSTQPKSYITPEEYLEIDRKAERKSEYYNGQMFPMHEEAARPGQVGDRVRFHSLLVVNLLASLHRQLRSWHSEIYPIQMRLHVGDTGSSAYPDVVVVCGDPRFLDDRTDTLLNPTLVIEVLSASTEAYDRGLKAQRYRTIDSLKEYLFVGSDDIAVELYTRRPDGRWLLTTATRMEDSLDLESIGCRLLLSDIYEKVDLAPTGQ